MKTNDVRIAFHTVAKHYNFLHSLRNIMKVSMWKGSINTLQEESMDDSRKNNIETHSTLKRSLAPLSKLTYYGGLLFDWYRPVKNQSYLSITFRCIVIAIVFLANAFQAAGGLVQFGRMVQSNKSQIQELVSEANEVTIELVILFTWIHFLCRRNSMLTFFTDWEKQQPALVGGTTKYRQAITTLWVTNGVYAVYGLFGTGQFCYVICCAFTENVWDRDNVFVSYFPSLKESSYYEVWCRFSLIAHGLSFGLFYALLDIVPMTVYYHGSKIIQAVNMDLEKMNVIDFKGGNDVAGGLERIWARFENSRVLLQRADYLFGFLMVLSNGDAFLGICTNFHSFLNYYINKSDLIEDLCWELLICFHFCFYLIRMVIGVVLVSKVSSSSSQLLSTAAFLSLYRCRLPENKEERRIIKSFLGRLESNQLAARPSGLYNITPTLFLTMLSLIISYTIILLQSKNNFPLNNLFNTSSSAV